MVASKTALIGGSIGLTIALTHFIISFITQFNCFGLIFSIFMVIFSGAYVASGIRDMRRDSALYEEMVEVEKKDRWWWKVALWVWYWVGVVVEFFFVVVRIWTLSAHSGAISALVAKNTFPTGCSSWTT